MAMKQGSSGMPMDMRNVKYWHENQVVLTFQSKLDSSEGPANIIKSLRLDRLNNTLNESPGHYNLRSFNETDVPGPHTSNGDNNVSRTDPSVSKRESDETVVRKSVDVLGKVVEAIGEGLETVGEKIEDLGKVMQGRDTQDEDDNNGSGQGLNSPVGKYLFSSPQGQGTLVITFFHVEQSDQPVQQDSTPGLVSLLNGAPGDFSSSEATFVASGPDWFNGGTQGPNGVITHGCPTMPSVQVEEPCNLYKYNLPQQFSLPQDGTGKGVTVFVLDTIPDPDSIRSAANDPGSNDVLLSNMAQNMVSVASDGTVTPPGATSAVPPAIKVYHTQLPDVLENPSPDQPATGKDIYGRLVGFPIPDHGLFIAGIIRDLAPDANIECIRVLNDYGVGNTTVLIDALTNINNRLGPGGDLNGQRVVINMSLVATPANEEIEDFGYTLQTIMPTRLALLNPMELLAAQGVVFAASTGNDSDPTDTPPMNPNGLRLGPRYPAAFAYPGVSDMGLDAMIPVGAVDNQGNVTVYSNYPGTNGIATYGGQRPQPDPANPGATVTNIIPPIDAPRGVFSSTLYPALAMEDTELFHSSPPFNYPEHLRNGSTTWAYWAGTSFATPVISAIAARILETWQPTDPSVRDIIVKAAMQQSVNSTTNWTNLESSYETASGPMILVTQDCQD
jgi:hypothetical protein